MSLRLSASPSRAHPRVGGENRKSSERRPNRWGSSPRGRGKPRREHGCVDSDGLIPAWAGKTVFPARSAASHRAHPRVGGENLLLVLPSGAVQGSSPRGRGKRRGQKAPNVHHGLIPAWAGKTRAAPMWSCSARAHPRVGGENSEPRNCAPLIHGSSPRGRGKPPRLRLRDSPRGLIPAWAGKTGPRPQRTWIPGAHPRVGGENAEPKRDPLGVTGSSPRGRGKPWPGRCATRSRRLIPAWAGKTLRLEIVYGWYAGSSPRGRGKQCRGCGVVPGDGLIPAWAGKTRPTRHQRRTAWAHPRVGGENTSRSRPIARASGSSPRGRGKPRSKGSGRGFTGLIPAWAGKTCQDAGVSGVHWAHPRVGGENWLLVAVRVGVEGSSPRGRGKPPNEYI